MRAERGRVRKEEKGNKTLIIINNTNRNVTEFM